MCPFRLLLPLAGFLILLQPAWADERDACRSNAGTLLIGTVASGLRFAHGHDMRGVELSHTHVRLRGDDGRIYDIAIDDVFASGYDQAGEHVPAPLSQIQPGNRLELCDKPYASGGPGMDWVHTSCGDQPAPDKPNGWVKVIGQDGTPGPNLELSEEVPPAVATLKRIVSLRHTARGFFNKPGVGGVIVANGEGEVAANGEDLLRASLCPGSPGYGWR